MDMTCHQFHHWLSVENRRAIELRDRVLKIMRASVGEARFLEAFELHCKVTARIYQLQAAHALLVESGAFEEARS